MRSTMSKGGPVACMTCCYFHPQRTTCQVIAADGTGGECRRFPPSADTGREGVDYGLGVWPGVHGSSDWCGAWAPIAPGPGNSTCEG